jgi:hypothetical protein
MTKEIRSIFIHHSTGANLLKYGKVRGLLKNNESNIKLWDHSYGLIKNKYSFPLNYHTGLSDFNGKALMINYDIPNDNTNPDGLEALFALPIDEDNAFTKIINNYDVIIFKSCYPITKIESDEKLEVYIKNYIAIKKRIDQFPEKLFIAFTPPPYRKFLTKKEYAKRARIFSNWLKSNEFLNNSKNLRVFDFFDLLSENDEAKNNFNMLKNEYCNIIPLDSHPNKKANEIIGPIFVGFLIKIVKEFYG